MQRSTLYDVHKALGATFAERGGWELPQHFGNVEAEYHAVRQHVGLCDLSHRGLVRITGADRQRFLHAMVSNDTEHLQPGQGCYATFLTNKGKLIADFVVYADADAYWLDFEPQMAQPFIDAIDFFVIADDVTFTDETANWGLLSLQGPEAADLLILACGQELPELPPYAHLSCQLAGHEVRLIRRSHTGEEGYQLLAPLDTLPAIWDGLWQHRDMCDARAVGLDALDILRIEAGIPLLGRDMTDETIPLEANLLDAISYTKGCYIGQEVISRIDARGHVNRQLRGLVLEGDTLPQSGDVILSPDREVGWITSVAHSPTLQQNIAMGYIRREVFTPGTHLEVRTGDAILGATVVELPFIKSAVS
jgi:glycine cleavage system T protein